MPVIGLSFCSCSAVTLTRKIFIPLKVWGRKESWIVIRLLKFTYIASIASIILSSLQILFTHNVLYANLILSFVPGNVLYNATTFLDANADF